MSFNIWMVLSIQAAKPLNYSSLSIDSLVLPQHHSRWHNWCWQSKWSDWQEQSPSAWPGYSDSSSHYGRSSPLHPFTWGCIKPHRWRWWDCELRVPPQYELCIPIGNRRSNIHWRCHWPNTPHQTSVPLEGLLHATSDYKSSQSLTSTKLGRLAIAYLVHTRVVSNSRIGWMGVTSNDGVRHHPNARVETSLASLSFQVSWNKVWMVLCSPLTFHIGMSGDDGVDLIIHAGKMGDNEKIGVAEKRQDSIRFRVQFGC